MPKARLRSAVSPVLGLPQPPVDDGGEGEVTEVVHERELDPCWDAGVQPRLQGGGRGAGVAGPEQTDTPQVERDRAELLRQRYGPGMPVEDAQCFVGGRNDSAG
jgi:hypothetical protein